MADNTSTDELEVWRLKSAGFHMRLDATEAGRLVRLADVVRWVMVSDELPLMPAVEAVCATLESQSPAPELFLARELYLAAPLPADEAFGYFTADRLVNILRVLEGVAERGETCSLRLSGYAPSYLRIDAVPLVTDAATAREASRYLAGTDPVEPGLPAALRYISEHWTADGWFGFLAQRTVTSADVLDDQTLRVAGLSLRFDAVRAIWGWCCTQQHAHASDAAASVVTWSNERIAKRSQELRLAGVKNFNQVVAEEAGIGGKDPTGVVRYRIRRHKEAQKPSALPSASNVHRINQG